jgi:hypothetical protein
LKPVEVRDAETSLQDELIDPSVQIAAAPDYSLDRIESILPGSDPLILASAMFKKEVTAGRFEHTSDFLECRDRVGDSAKRPGTDYAIKGSISKRKRFRTDSGDVNRKRRGLDPLPHAIGQERCRIHGMQQ